MKNPNIEHQENNNSKEIIPIQKKSFQFKRKVF